MMKWFLTLVCFWCFSGFLSNIHSQPDIQYRADSLNIGTSNLDQVKRLFGEPAAQKDFLEYQEGWRNGKFDGLYMEKTLDLNWVKDDIKSGELTIRNKRTVHDFEYSNQGLIITLLDNPWQVNAVTITNNAVEVWGVRVGDQLAKLKKRLANGRWFTTDVENGWW